MTPSTEGTKVKSVKISAMLLALAAGWAASAADEVKADVKAGVKVGMVTTLSGPGASLGVDIRDGFNLALKHLGNKFGNLPVEVLHTFLHS